MKFMPAIAAEALGPRAIVDDNSDLSMEGIVDKTKSAMGWLKEKFTPSDEAKLKAEAAAKQAVLEKQMKLLQKTKSQVSSARDDKQHVMSTRRISHCNFSASNAGEVLAGMQKNRKHISSALSRLKNAKSKQEVQSVHDGLEAEFAKKGVVAKEITVDRAMALKILDESIMTNELLQQYMKLLHEVAEVKASHESISMEGFGENLVVAVLVFAYIVYFVVVYVVTVYLWVLVFTAPFIGIPLMILWFAILISLHPGDEEEDAEHLYAEAHKR